MSWSPEVGATSGWYTGMTDITVANSGIGFALAALLLADASKHILLGCRSVEKGAAALEELQSQDLAGSVELLELDVGSQDSIARAAKRVEVSHGRFVRLTKKD